MTTALGAFRNRRITGVVRIPNLIGWRGIFGRSNVGEAK